MQSLLKGSHMAPSWICHDFFGKGIHDKVLGTSGGASGHLIFDSAIQEPGLKLCVFVSFLKVIKLNPIP